MAGSTVGAGLVSGLVVLGVSAGIDRWLEPATGLSLPPAVVSETSLIAGLAMAVWVLARRLRPPPATESWAVGATGEVAVAAALAPLAAEGWRVLHDRRVPGRRANIDHVAVGPGGVWVVETKRWSGRLVVGAGRLRHNGRAADAVYDQVWRQADQVTRVLPRFGVPARPVVCLVDGAVEHGRDPAGRPVRGPVEFHTPDSLVRRLRAAAPVLSPDEVAAAAAAIDRGLPPA